MADPLRSLNGRVVEQVLVGSLQTIECRRIETISEVQPDRSDGCALANAEAYRLHHVIEVGDVALFVTEGNTVQAGVDVAHVMEEHAGHVVAQEREPQFGGMEK